MRGLQSTEKVSGRHHTFRRTGIGQPLFCKRIGGHYIMMLKHKNRPVALLTGDKYEKEFHVTQMINPTEARSLIGWLARFIAMSDPDPVSMAIAETRAHANGIMRSQDKIAEELGLKQA